MAWFKLQNSNFLDYLGIKFESDHYWTATMLTTDAGDEICWWQFWDVSDWFITWTKSPTLRQKSPFLLFCNQHRKTFIIIKSPTYRCHQHHRTLISLIWCIFDLSKCGRRPLFSTLRTLSWDCFIRVMSHVTKFDSVTNSVKVSEL